MRTSCGHDQDAEPPTPDDRQPDLVEVDPDDETRSDSGSAPGTDPDPDAGQAADQAGTDS